MCQLNFSCSTRPRESFFDNNLYEFTNLTYNWLQFANQPEITNSVSNLIQFGNAIMEQRRIAESISNKRSLSSVIKMKPDQFKTALTNLSLYPIPLNADTISLILSSNPNFNYLYSNYSENYTEPLAKLLLGFGVDQSAINVLYGPDLDVI